MLESMEHTSAHFVLTSTELNSRALWSNPSRTTRVSINSARGTTKIYPESLSLPPPSHAAPRDASRRLAAPRGACHHAALHRSRFVFPDLDYFHIHRAIRRNRSRGTTLCDIFFPVLLQPGNFSVQSQTRSTARAHRKILRFEETAE